MGKNKKAKGGKGKPKKASYKKPKSMKQSSKGPSNSQQKMPDKSTLPLENPFELRMNKRKHDNLGRMARNEQGVPGISRSRAVEKRKATLLQEYKVRNKSSSLQDNRIGEKRKGMPEEEKINRRSAAEKAKQFRQKSIFNLQDGDDFLTHKGQPLMDIDRYEDPRDASDSEEERLDADFVSDANFGGFMKVKRAEDQEINEEDIGDDGQPKSHKQIIQELILASKKKKHEKAKEADENYELVCKLDDDFKNPDIRNLLLMGGGKKDPGGKKAEEPPTQKEDYDKIVRELQFEAKTGRATDRLKTDDEVALEEKEKLEQLEKERLRRMEMTDSDGNIKHRSADDLDDGFFVEKDEIEEDAIGDDEEEDGESGAEDEEGEEDSEEESDAYSDIDSETETQTADDPSSSLNPTKTKGGNEICKDVEKTNEEILSQIPFVFAIPAKYKEFESILKKYKGHYKFKNSPSSTNIFNVILTRIVTYNKASDRTRLPNLFNYILRYVLETAEKLTNLSKYVVKISEIALPHLHALLVLNPSGCVDAVEKGEIMDDFFPLKGLPIQKLLYFDLCTQLFSVTDFHHRVLSGMKTKLLEVLSRTKATDATTLAKLLYITKIILKITVESKRYCPEIINLLDSILLCYAGDEKGWTSFAIPSIRFAKSFLFIKKEKCSSTSTVNEQLWTFLSNEPLRGNIDTPHKLGFLSATLKYIKKFIPVHEKLPSSIEIYSPIKKSLLELQKNTNWPQKISLEISTTLEAISAMKQKKEALIVPISDKPKPLKLYEPLIEDDFDGVRKKKCSKGKQEASRLTHKVKQEMKNAIREIRKDTSFLAKQQLREQIEKDSERKRKVKEILGSLADQEGEYQKCKRAKK